MATLSTSKNPVSIRLQEDHLTLSFDCEWFQEDIAKLTESIFLQLTAVTIQEQIIGADRENIRFNWQQGYFILNFECYSQSCWIEGQDAKNMACLTELYLAIKNDAR